MTVRILFLSLATLALGACTPGRPKERINPPAVSIQELRIEEGRCHLQLRVHNHSSVSMHFRNVQLDEFEVDGRDLAPLSFDADREIPPYIGEPILRELPCPDMTPDASELVYTLSGLITTDKPTSRRFDVRHQSRLLPVPGLPSTYR
ncbi:hypothetical protein [Pseudofulvimonas gallinarii]|jgi:hypothetical protein|uniref:Lipoprotein n=1 Tax=Pseudofulvimonas gallinarii TaxID=634155 RepID=A0A4R3LET4_9GAMM|nr:hypothetical protein [Pseudofulvimonas gallinarii]TCS98573.1 hypothetical protein EDC25_108158 [Pseudofulvimonas gallinarii]THD12974.1 hypothetical protein B1808_10430 [Pseudofulvimonas gallinarii]